ncbi:MAG: polysaccharide deacetylase family protein [Rubrobacteraceae bacterium]
MGVLALSLVLALLLIGVLTHGAWSSEQAYLRPVSPVESGTPPAPPKHPDSPDSSSPDMEKVWAAAADEDSWPRLATGAKTGTFGGKISLTFDDGPEPRTTPKILDTLKKHDLKATFFVLGRQVKEHPGLLRRIVEEGHIVGNHTYDHADLSALSTKQTRRELESTQKAVDDALGYHYPMAVMRPPYGDPYLAGTDALPAFRRIAREQELFPVIWTIDPSDYLYVGDPQGVARGVVRADKAERRGKQRKGDQVVLLHDNQGQTARALPRIIDYYERSGRRFTNVNELLADKYLNP